MLDDPDAVNRLGLIPGQTSPNKNKKTKNSKTNGMHLFHD